MALSSMALLTGATLAATGGTSKTYAPDGQEVSNGLHVADMSVTDFPLRPQFTFRNRNPKRLPDGTYTKGKRFITYYRPILKADGTIAPNVYRYECEIDPETSAAETLDAQKMMAQAQFDADTADFMANGNVA